jgi:hypothetical protein
MTSFSSPAIHIDENGIDLLRNRFAYQHLNFSEVKQFRIEDGHLMKNRWVIFAIGFTMIFFAFKLVPVWSIYSELPQSSAHPSVKGIAYLMLIPLSLIGMGGYFVVQSLRKSKILHLETRTEQFNIRICEIEKAGKLRGLEEFLQDKLIN